MLDRLKKKVIDEEVEDIVNLLMVKLDKMIELLEEQKEILKKIEKNTEVKED
jgi:hypothetical protein